MRKNIISNKKISRIVENCIKKVIPESLSQSVYHFTSVFSLLKILNENEMFCQAAKVGFGADDMNNKYDFYISFTRAKSSQEGFGYTSTRIGSIARIEFDGDKLNKNFHGKPVNYWGDSDSLNNKFSYMKKAQNNKHFEYKEITDKNLINRVEFKKLPPFTYLSLASENSPDYVEKDGKYYVKVQGINPDIQHHTHNEIEDRLFTNKPIIENVRKYIKRVDIFVDEKIKDNQENSQLMATLTQISLMYSNFVFIYNNLKDFDRQSDNTINKYYSSIEMFGKYGRLLPKMSRESNVDFLNDICNLITFFEPNETANKKKASLLRKYGLDKYINQVLSKRNGNFSLKILFNNIGTDSQNASKEPTRDGQIMLKMMNDFLRSKGYSSIMDAYKKMSEELNKRNGYSRNSIDIDTPIKIKYIEFKDYNQKYIINKDGDTDFWFVFSMEDMHSRYNFIENLIYSLDHGDYGEHFRNVIRGGLETFTKYLQNLAHKKVTINQMFTVFDKIGLNPNEVMNYERGMSFEIKSADLNYYGACNYGLYPPFKCEWEEKYEYVKNLFKEKH